MAEPRQIRSEPNPIRANPFPFQSSPLPISKSQFNSWRGKSQLMDGISRIDFPPSLSSILLSAAIPLRLVTRLSPCATHPIHLPFTKGNLTVLWSASLAVICRNTQLNDTPPP